MTALSKPAAGAAADARILIVDDDPALQALLAGYLSDAGLTPLIAASRAEMVAKLRAEPHLVILGLQLGRCDGLDLLRLIRTQSDVPVIIATTSGGGEIDRVIGLEMGADDCVTKPFGLRELLARVRAVLRRGGVEFKRAPRRGRVRFAVWELDRLSHVIRRPGEAGVVLTNGEYGLLQAFLEAPGRPLSREDLLRATRVHEDVFDRSIDVKILRLRRKLEFDPSAPRLIETLRGVGYVFTATVQAA